jgi:hypothetical protein
LIFSLTSARAANKILANGLFVCQKKNMQKNAKRNRSDALNAMDGTTMPTNAQGTPIPATHALTNTTHPNAPTRPDFDAHLAEWMDMQAGTASAPYSNGNATR